MSYVDPRRLRPQSLAQGKIAIIALGFAEQRFDELGSYLRTIQRTGVWVDPTT